MRLPEKRALPPFPWRTSVRIFGMGLGLAAGFLLIGRIAEYESLGRDESAARDHVAGQVREFFDEVSRSLRATAQGLADPGSVLAVSQGDTTAARRMFDAAAATLGGVRSDELAVTAYAADFRPLAWAGRPSELPVARLQGGEAWFLTQSALGLRLVYVTPVSSSPDGRRIGAVAAERTLDSRPISGGVQSGVSSVAAGLQAPRDEVLLFAGALTPISIDASGRARAASLAGPTFQIAAPSGDHLATASVAPEDLARTRARWRRAALSLALLVLAIAVLLSAGPVLDSRGRAAHARASVVALAAVAVLVVASRGLLRLASPADWSNAPLFSAAAYASPMLGTLLASPFDFLLTATMAGGLVTLAFVAVEGWRLDWRHRRRPLATRRELAACGVAQLVAGAAVAAVLIAHQHLLRDTIANTTVDLLRFALYPVDRAALPRLALQAGLILWHATTLALAVLLLRAANIAWRVPRHDWRLRVARIAAWMVPLLVWQLAANTSRDERPAEIIALLAAVVLASFATRVGARYRHGSQAFRLTALALGLVAPALAFYPSVFRLAWRAKAELVETRYAPQALNQRQTIQTRLQQSLAQIDRLDRLPALVGAAGPAASGAPSDRAFQVWINTALAAYPITSSVELYGPDGTLTSRFAFNLPTDLTAPRSEEQTCEWQIFEGVSPFFAEERRVLHAGRAICSGESGGRPRIVGSIAVNAILDYANLPFISSQNPYVEALRPADPLRDEGLTGGDVEYVVYGWSRRPLYSSRDTAWPLDEAAFARVAQSRAPQWARLTRGDDRYDVYLMNDRGGIYALGFPTVSALGHFINIAELTVLAVGTYLLFIALNAMFGLFSRRVTSAPALLREVRASFYRKLFLAFVVAAFAPVITLAVVTRYYIAGQMRDHIEQEAARTASAARRVVADLAAPRAAQQGVGVDDNLMVWVSRLIDQDVNIFAGPRLVATSERNLFASGLLPTRTPAPVYRALELENQASAVVQERIGAFEYLVAATSMGEHQLDALLSVPFTLRQQEIEHEIDMLDRRVVLGALVFILAGAGIGYWAAERIADPVSRLTRATQRIARGDLDQRVAVTSSDELRRLVEAFNSMARDLQRQRVELERTHRLEAWAEMARQVAHEIKNPLTPIQLNAEHLRRVHADRGQPLGPVLENAAETILAQVKLLRQIASEFSSFASSPTARRGPVSVTELLSAVIEPYQMALKDRIRLDIDVPPVLPLVHADRTLISRSLTNIIENALHAMPGEGTLSVAAAAEHHAVRIRVSDTGVGMDAEALARVFEPYFSTKAAGTGLGLPIAKRNIELNGGTVTVTSERNRGTTVELTLPIGDGERQDDPAQQA